MSRDEDHGGGSWGFGQCLWSPSHKRNNTRWAFWDTLLHVKEGDPVLHLRGKGEKAAFIGVSQALSDGFETTDYPPNPGEWGYAKSFHKVPLYEYITLHEPIKLYEVFTSKNAALRDYFALNRDANEKLRLFYVLQAGRLQCLNGAYLSQADEKLTRLLLDQAVGTSSDSPPAKKEVRTGEQLIPLLARIGQREFADNVRRNYQTNCCFPGCDVAERPFLRGAHIARWSDVPELRGKLSNGLCLCLMHDHAFERGLFTVDMQHRVWVNPLAASNSLWAKDHLEPVMN